MNARQKQRAALLLILLAAALLRFYKLDTIPPGLTHDEANNVHDAAAVLQGARPAYFPVAQGKEPLYPYSVALTMAVLGPSTWAMRLTSALWGLALILLAYVWTRRAFGSNIALLNAAWLAVSFWPLSTSRMGLRAIALPVLFTAAIYLANGRESAWRYVLGGVALGASWYTYLAARVMPLVFALFFVYLLTHRKIAWGILLTLTVAAIVAAPLIHYLGAHPSAEIRIGQLDQPLRDLLGGDPGPLLELAGQTLQIFTLYGDTFIPYNIPGKPLLDPLTGLLFYAGLALALRRWRQPAYALALLWLAVGFAPALATGVEAANLRAIAAQPVLYLFPALALHAIICKSTNIQICKFAILTLFIATAALTCRDYFVSWAEHRDTRVHHHADLVAIAQYIRQHPGQPYVISALYPGQYHDPRVVEAELRGDDQHLRWADGRQALVLPGGDAPVLIIVPAAVPLDPALQDTLELEHIEHITVRPDDLNPSFDVYRWQQTTQTTPPALAQFGTQLQLLDAQLRPTQAAPGDTVTVITTWQIIAPLPADRDAVIFTQLLGPDGIPVTQQDRLDAPSWNWTPGDRLIQLHRLTLPTETLPPASYRTITGLYTLPDRIDAVLAGREPDPAAPRLPVTINGQPSGDHLELPTLEVVPRPNANLHIYPFAYSPWPLPCASGP